MKVFKFRQQKLQQQTTVSTVAIFWMDNFSKIYVTDYNYHLTEVPWKLRNQTATAVFLADTINALDLSKYSLAKPLPAY